MDLDPWFLAQELLAKGGIQEMADVDGLTKSRLQIIERLEHVEELLISGAADRIARKNDVDDVVVGVGGGDLDLTFIYPKDLNERNNTVAGVDAINFELTNSKAVGAAVLRDGVWVTTDGETHDAIMISLHVRGWGRTSIIPYKTDDDGVAYFMERVVKEGADNSLVWVCADT